jgi:5-methylcytosine-specific restriction endonuclease McrA
VTRPLPPDWKKRRAAILERDPICTEPDCGELSTDVDHTVPRAFGGSDEPDNLKGKCKTHHGRKTHREKVSPFECLE